MNVFWVFLGGGLGAIMRYGVSYAFQKWQTSPFPWSTLLVNFFAAILLGMALVLFRNKTDLYLFTAVGICGGFSTFSTFAKENLDLIDQNSWLLFFTNVFMSTLLCIAAVYVGKKLI